MGCRVDLHLGQGDHVPFEDREFDYVSIMTVLEFVDDPGSVLREAVRVARKGVLVTFEPFVAVWLVGPRLFQNSRPCPGPIGSPGSRCANLSRKTFPPVLSRPSPFSSDRPRPGNPSQYSVI